MRRAPLAVLAVVLSLTACAQTPAPVSESPAGRSQSPRNVVLFIADGFGPTAATLGSAASHSLGRDFVLDTGLRGSVETSASDSRVTDSAAGATAYSCGIKTYNGAIGVTDDREPCTTILELAEARGMATGLVATSRITHATPASFASHVESRGEEAEIASQMITSGVDVMFGGGRAFFDAREDGRDLLASLRQSGAAVATTGAEFDALASTPAVALLAPSHLAYEVDRARTDQPSIAEMTTRALALLADEAGETGFFLMVEASRIDHAEHGNDPVGTLHDILAYDEAVAAALAWAEADGETLIVGTADHETGGLSLARDGIYAWDPQPLLDATMSQEGIREAIAGGADPVETIRDGLGVELAEGVPDAIRGYMAAQDLAALQQLVVDLISEPAGIGWTTGGHTAVDVGLYAWGPGAEAFRGHMTNAEVGRRLFQTLGLEPPVSE